MRLFGMWCPVMGGGPSVTIVHIIDFPFEESDSFIEEVLTPYGKVKTIKKQKFLAMDDIFTGTRLVSLVMKTRPPRDLMIKGYLCRTWYRGQPLVCNLCAVEGHRSANCPNKDKCRRCGESGHFARGCPKTRVSFADAVAGSARVTTAASGPSDAPATELSDSPVPSSGWLTRLRSRFSSAPDSGGVSGDTVGTSDNVPVASGGPSGVVPPVVPSEVISGNASVEVPVHSEGVSTHAPVEPVGTSSTDASSSPEGGSVDVVPSVAGNSSDPSQESVCSDLTKDNELDQLLSQSILPSQTPAVSGAAPCLEHVEDGAAVAAPSQPLSADWGAIVDDEEGKEMDVSVEGGIAVAASPQPLSVGNEARSEGVVSGVEFTDPGLAGIGSHDLQRKARRSKTGRSGESSSRKSPLDRPIVSGRHNSLPAVVPRRSASLDRGWFSYIKC